MTQHDYIISCLSVLHIGMWTKLNTCYILTETCLDSLHYNYRLEVLKAEKEYRMFPDEVDTPINIPARTRFAKLVLINSVTQFPHYCF